MREVNFSIPNVNKASVGITTALYDRRALDCTSTLPLINSLNHLAYLTTSSARIRDILTVDGGVERLVCLLKAGRSKDMMDMWKWNLAFQCVVNIGVRGSENVRTRVVEADMVPVIATILDNYIKVVDRCREKAEEAKQKALLEHRHQNGRSGEHRSTHKGPSFGNRASRFESEFRASRRQPPPPSIDIPSNLSATAMTNGSDAMDITPTGPQFALTSPPERTTFSVHRHHHHHRNQDARQHFLIPRHNMQPLATAVPSMDAADGFNIRPVRDVDRLPSMLPGFQGGLASQPESPTTPLPPHRCDHLPHQVSSAADTEDMNADSMASDESGEPEMTDVSTADIQATNVNIQDVNMDENDSMLTAVETPLGLTTPTVSEAQDAGTFNITHRSAMDGSMINDATTPTGPTIGLSPAQPTTVNTPPTMPPTTIPRYFLDRPTPPQGQVLAAMPRDEDVLMSLQLLAYVSKYCNLRSYFQQSHLVPKLKIGSELQLLDVDETNATTPAACSSHSHDDEAEEEEYLLPDDFNIFPLVEKFTVRHHSQDMQYWAGVVMRNLCRKDDARGGIRQCAYYQCGKWEEYTRQFAKCRRCRRTKYCSKECQKSAWVFHRHWCVQASQ
ncbi:MYND finger [Botrytis cinerea]